MFILVLPLTVKVKAYDPVLSGIAYVSITRENPLDLVLDLMLLALNRHRVIPLYTQVNARGFTESRGRLIHVPGSVSTFPCLTT